MKKRIPVSVRLERNSIPEPNSGCTLWLGSSNKEGYGRIGVSGRSELATHAALRVAGREVPRGMLACHTCDNPYCINPDHLYVGTHQDNMRDMVRKRRGTLARTHCPQGHPYSGKNLRINAHGYRTCLTCTQAASRKSYEARRAKTQA
jgi:hypothetical protein